MQPLPLLRAEERRAIAAVLLSIPALWRGDALGTRLARLPGGRILASLVVAWVLASQFTTPLAAAEFFGGNDRYVSMCRKHFKENFFS